MRRFPNRISIGTFLSEDMQHIICSEYDRYHANMGLYDAEVAFEWIERNIR